MLDKNMAMKFIRPHLVELQSLDIRGIASFPMTHLAYGDIKLFIKAVAHGISPFSDSHMKYAIDSGNSMMYEDSINNAKVKPKYFKNIPAPLLDDHRLAQLNTVQLNIEEDTCLAKRTVNYEPGVQHTLVLSNIRIGEYVVETLEIFHDSGNEFDPQAIKDILGLNDKYDVFSLNTHTVILPSYLSPILK